MQSAGKPPTLKTIAELTGLSLSTVSLSLRDPSKLKQDTNDKVEQAARKVGYVPNRAGVRLRTGRTNVLALVLANDKNTIDYTRLLVEGIGAQIRGTKYHLSVVPDFGGDDPVAAVQYVLENRAADGIILNHTTPRDPRVQMLMQADFPFVSHGRTEFFTPHAFHDFHSERYIQMAVTRLLAKGRRHVLLAAVDNRNTNYANIVNAFTKAIATSGSGPVLGDVVRPTDVLHTAAAARAYGRDLAARAQPYDAIICSDELTALALIYGLKDGDQHLGRDYDMISKQTSDILPVLYPETDTVAEDFFAAGGELARLLLARIEGQAPETLQSFQEPVPSWTID